MKAVALFAVLIGVLVVVYLESKPTRLTFPKRPHPHRRRCGEVLERAIINVTPRNLCCGTAQPNIAME